MITKLCYHNGRKVSTNIVNNRYQCAEDCKRACPRDFGPANLDISRPVPPPQERFRVVSGADLYLKSEEIQCKFIKEMSELDDLVYESLPNEEKWTVERNLEIFEKNPRMYFFVEDTASNRLAGYAQITPITKECFQKIMKGELCDSELPDADIVSDEDCADGTPRYLNFTSIAIHPDYKKERILSGRLVSKIKDMIVKKIIQLAEEEKIFFLEMIADTVSEDGEKLCKMFGMKEVVRTNHSNQSKIYKVSLLPPSPQLDETSIHKKAYEKYKKIYDDVY